MKSILLDTNAYSALIRGDADTSTILKAATRVFIPVVVIAELRAGFQTGTKVLENEIILSAFIKKSTVLEVSLETTQHYAKLVQLQQNKGRPIPTNDIWIAAIARQHQLPLLSFDGHFRGIEDLQVVQTPAEFSDLEQR